VIDVTGAGVAEARDDQSADPRLEPAFPAERRVAASLPGEAAADDAVDVLVAEDAADEMLPQHRLVAVTVVAPAVASSSMVCSGGGGGEHDRRDEHGR
jgi:hypothetical protein